MNNEERQLIINSITHWNRDAVDMFDRGFELNVEDFKWFQYMQENIECKLDRNNCPLCNFYYNICRDCFCNDCLWYFTLKMHVVSMIKNMINLWRIQQKKML